MALRGVQIVEMAGLAPVPFCGMVLADFGATVIRVCKIEGELDFDCLANGKKSLALNVKHPKGVEILRRICKKSDVLIEPFRKGVMEKLGLGPNILLEDNPQLVYARLTGFGQYGKYSKMAGHDINYIAVSGLLSLLGRKNEKPTAPINLAADFGGGGLLCALGIMMALYERTNSGFGQVVDANMVEGSAYLSSWIFRSQKHPYWGQPRGENMLDTGSHFYDTYETKDGKYMAVGALEPQFYSKLLHGLGFSDEEVPQMENSEAHRELFTKRFQERTQQEWCEVFDGTDACVTPVLSLDEAPKHPHNAERNSFVTYVDHNIPAPAAAPRLSRTPPVTKAMEPKSQHGEHTVEILIDNNYTMQEVQQLEHEGVIATKKSKL
ncbi:Alpha-methylacyl-CoA racemase [Cryptotermes secundus]|uniref:Alpha-methylacyl-CoA racemase n=2 Tax=Cryptotermes secundus TaxID=105785 RepID=A0A2J7RL54_9NEOP|nr:alpha-methylacyl-CoA racemase [Cryptotermes secundus]XP_023721671.1 alpha-methylacyl-CoA racemase [Cryptotermes secundus]XP_023721682.1 alpha-methylacyl-CoA racemase [Cryptotermes secundus]XP_023721699.1 alpha-methylacyl-CoA racemase [Cryptotermes secundus]XP_033610508.1 alpha-methylacyl-CoA racemase [Cryptotermes secundus]PNF41560.1 Alpha-methylacyl-CoA racemase [Cryptotermes secundus]PNF41562.1 Alpha-methylacyl-CoA racemase [Cryptotermes secundus]